VAEANDAERKGPPSGVRITVIVQNRYRIDTAQVTEKQMKETANVPAGFSLYRRVQGGNEPIPDDALVERRNGDHLFPRPPSNVAIDEEEP
jgi:hypothetical protein